MTLVPIQPVSMSILSGAVDSMLESLFLNDPVSSVTDVLTLNIFSDPSISAMLRAGFNALIPIACMLLIVYFCVSMIDKGMTLDNMSASQMWRQVVLLIGSAILLNHSFDLLQYIYNFGLGIFDYVHTALGTAAGGSLPTTADELRDLLGMGNGLGDDLAAIINLFLPWLLAKLFPIIIKAICYMRLLELSLRLCMMPLSLADFFQNGLHGAGMRNLKGFLAVALQTAAIYLILVLNQVLVVGASSSVDDAFIIVYLAIWVATLGLLFRSQSLCKEIIGA